MESFNEFFKKFILEAEDDGYEEYEETDRSEGSTKIIDYVLDDSLDNDFEALKQDKEFKDLLSFSKPEDIKEALKELYENYIEADDAEVLPEKKTFIERVVNFLQEKVQK